MSHKTYLAGQREIRPPSEGSGVKVRGHGNIRTVQQQYAWGMKGLLYKNPWWLEIILGCLFLGSCLTV